MSLGAFINITITETLRVHLEDSEKYFVFKLREIGTFSVYVAEKLELFEQSTN